MSAPIHDRDELLERVLEGEATAAEREAFERACEDDADFAHTVARRRALERLLEPRAEDPPAPGDVQRVVDGVLADEAAADRRRWRIAVAAAALIALLPFVPGRLLGDADEPQLHTAQLPTVEPAPIAAEGPAPVVEAVEPPSFASRLATTLGDERLATDRIVSESRDFVAGSDRHVVALRRDAEGLLDASMNAGGSGRAATLAVERAALRLLGEVGDVRSGRAIATRLDDPELRSEAAAALARLGPTGWELLADELDSAPDAEQLLALWPADDDRRAVELLAERLRPGTPLAAPIAGRLLSTGPHGVRSVLEARDAERLTRSELRLAAAGLDVDATVEVLTALRPSPARCELAAACATREVLPILEDGLRDDRLRGAAMNGLAAVPFPEALALLVAARDDGHVPDAGALGAMRRASPSPQRWLDVVESLERHDDRRLDALAELLIGQTWLARDPALGRLARSSELSSDLRALCVEQAGLDSIPELSRLVLEADSDDSRLAARALVRVAQAGDPDRVERQLAATGGGRAALEALEAQLERPTTSGLLRLARELRYLLPLSDDRPTEAL